MLTNTSPSLADIAAVTDTRNSDGLGNGNGWWILIILFAIFGGWGNGWGGNNNATRAATTTDLQNGFDTQSILNKLNGINNGLCDGFYAMNTGVLQSKYDIQQALNSNNITAMQNANSLATQMSQCCCENRQGQAQIQYDLATDTCAITNAVNQASRDISENCNANYRSLHDEIVAMRMEDKNEQIANLQSQIQQLNLTASQCAQNAYLVQQLRPSPIPAYNVANPYSSYGCYMS